MLQPINKATAALQNLLPFTLPLLLMVGLAWLAHSPLFQHQPEALSLGITVDLIVTLPLFYLFLIRNRDIPNITAIPYVIAGVLLAGWLIPPPHQFYLTQFKTWGLPLLEGVVLLVVIRKVRIALKQYHEQSENVSDVFDALKAAAQSVLPGKLGVLLATELGVIYYGFFCWKKRPLERNEFSYHRKGGAVALFSVLIFLVLAETAVLHLLLQQWSPTAAWLLSMISLYGALQLFGIARSLGQRPIIIEPDALILRYGIMSEAVIPREDISAVERFSAQAASPPTLSPLGEWEDLNVIIHLRKASTLHQLYGRKKTFTTLVFHADEPDALVEMLSPNI